MLNSLDMTDNCELGRKGSKQQQNILKVKYDILVYSLGLPVGFSCSRIKFCVLLSPYLCFITFLYLHLYVIWMMH